MKKIMLVVAIVGFAFAANAQSTKKESKKEKSKTEQMPLKDHVCTDACHKSGKCVYAHGEKGHTCGEECKKMMMNKDGEMKDHVCAASCKDGNHMYAHGEKGHTCGDECKKMK